VVVKGKKKWIIIQAWGLRWGYVLVAVVQVDVQRLRSPLQEFAPATMRIPTDFSVASGIWVVAGANSCNGKAVGILVFGRRSKQFGFALCGAPATA
jgi:hypothetical protein